MREAASFRFAASKQRSAHLGLCFVTSAVVTVAALCGPLVGTAAAATFSVKIWADANAGGGPGINSDHTITFGPGNQNLFLSENGNIYSTTGGSSAASFTFEQSIPDFCSANEGSAFFSDSSTLYVGSEDCENVYAFPVTGTGSSVAVGSDTVIDGENGNEPADTGEPAEFDDAEGVAIFTGTPRFNDTNHTPMYATSFAGPTLLVNGTTFPVVDANWSGKTMLVVNEEDNNLVALRIRNDGTVVTPGFALAQANGAPFSNANNPDAVAATPDGRFAYVHDEDNPDFYRFDLQHVDPSGGSEHIMEFVFATQNWGHDGLTVLNNSLYATAESPFNPGVTALFRIGIDPRTGDLGTPEYQTDIRTADGTAATSADNRLATDGTCILESDANTGLVFRICELTAAPALGGFGLMACTALLFAIAAWSFRKRGACE